MRSGFLVRALNICLSSRGHFGAALVAAEALSKIVPMLYHIFCMLINRFSLVSQHDTCPVCRKSLDGVDNSLPPTSEPLDVHTVRREQQERQTI